MKPFKKLLLISFIISFCFCDEVLEVSVLLDKATNQYRFAENVFEARDEFIAGAKYTRSLESKGWDLLAIKTNSAFDDLVQAEAAGYLEGFLTRDRIWNHYRNLRIKTMSNDNLEDNINEYLTAQEKWLEDTFKAEQDDPIIYNAYLTLKQLNGLRKAYNQFVGAEMKIEHNEFHVMTSFGDLFDIKYYKKTHAFPDFSKLDTKRIKQYFHENNHCSALFKVKEDMTDIFFGHNSWFYYSAMTRIFKEYNFNFTNKHVKAKNIIFSSYPATLASMDDFYVTSQNLAIIETTNSIFDKKLFEKVTPNGLLCWQRAMTAHRLSSSAKEWVNNFSKYNAGTYNNQFMALDMNKINLKDKKISEEAMYIIEQIPGDFEITDVTNYLRFGYWPSYNVPFSKRIFDKSGYLEELQRRPDLEDLFNYSRNARANIFRRDQSTVTNEDKFKKLIRYNDYKNDAMSLKDPSNTISSRIDFDYSCMGAYDAKMSSVSKVKGKNKRISVIAGPTNEQQPNFKWDRSFVCKKDPRFGLSAEYKFEWFEYVSEFQIDDTEENLKFFSE
jgi:hypothetical protein